MQTPAVAIDQSFPGFRQPTPMVHKPSALRSLMQMWEAEQAADEGESEAELMVALSGMVGAHATALDDE